MEDLTPVSLEGSAEVVDGDAGEAGHDGVGDARGKLAEQHVVNPLRAPAGDDVVTFFKLGQEGGHFQRIVLQVAVHGEDELAFGVVEAGGQRGGLAEVAAQLDNENAAVDGGNLFKQAVGAGA